jgi:PAS domain S-box-containing protein
MWSNTALLDHEGSVEYVIATGIDITKRKKAEDALRESEERHRLLLEVSPDPIVLYDLEGRSIYVNPAFEQTFGWSLGELRGKRIDFVPDENWPETKEAIKRMLQGVKIQLLETRRLTKDGRILDVQLSTSLFHDRDENPAGNIVILRDVSARKRAEEALRKAHDELERRVEERTAELLEANEQLKQEIEERKRTEQALHFTQFAIDRSSDAAFWMGSDARFIYVNEAACHTLGYSRDELLKMTVHDIDPDFPKEIWLDHWAEVKRQGYFVIESHHHSKDGRIFPVEISINYLEFGGKEYNCAFARDISERKKVEKAIELSKKEWVSTFDAMSDWICLIDLKYRVLRSNRAGENFASLPTEEMIGQTCYNLVHGTEEPIPECPLQKMLQTHQRETTDLYVQEMNRWLRISVDPVMDDDGNLVQAVHIVRDITELKKMEEERLKSMKLESIGILAGGIAHDFNNLLSIIMGNIELAKDDIKPEVVIYEFLTEAEKEGFLNF